jgi:hypothetical protein
VEARDAQKWARGRISVSIGQGQVSLTPVSMAVYMAGQRRTRVTPHLKAVDDGSGWPVPPPPPIETKSILALQAMRRVMVVVMPPAPVNGANRADVPGKTGSARSSRTPDAPAKIRKPRDHGWSLLQPRISGRLPAWCSRNMGSHGMPRESRPPDTTAKQEGPLRPLPTDPPGFSDPMA